MQYIRIKVNNRNSLLDGPRSDKWGDIRTESWYLVRNLKNSARVNEKSSVSLYFLAKTNMKSVLRLFRNWLSVFIKTVNCHLAFHSVGCHRQYVVIGNNVQEVSLIEYLFLELDGLSKYICILISDARSWSVIQEVMSKKKQKIIS